MKDYTTVLFLSGSLESGLVGSGSNEISVYACIENVFEDE